MKVVILAGGLGTRLSEETVIKPKPMVEIGGRPILWHIMSIYANYGYSEFALALGYKGETIKEYFLNYHFLNNNFCANLKSGKIDIYDGTIEDWSVQLIDTGMQTKTGGRIKRIFPWLGNDTFLLTYGDGVSDVNIDELVRFHHEQGKLATVTAVHPPARYGEMKFEGERVTEFEEKPQGSTGWVNGGFFVLEPGVMDYIDGDETDWEQRSLARLAEDGQLAAYRHEGFWQSMDTLRDVRMLESMWQSPNPPWKVWQ